MTEIIVRPRVEYNIDELIRKCLEISTPEWWERLAILVDLERNGVIALCTDHNLTIGEGKRQRAMMEAEMRRRKQEVIE